MSIRKTVAGMLAGGLALGVTGPVGANISNKNRGYGAGKYALELDGIKCGWVSDVEGGNAVGDVVAEKVGGDHLQRKHIGSVKYEEISFKVGSGMCRELYNWIETGFNQTTNQAGKGRMNGAIVFADYDAKELRRLEFTKAIVTGVGMPALDAASKDAATMTLKFKPELTRKKVGTGARVNLPMGAAKKWLPSNFRLRVDGLDTSRVSQIEPLTIKQKVTENAVGEMRDYEQEATAVEVPNLVITLAESHAEPFYGWHESFVIKGQNDQSKEKSGSLEYLAPDLKTVLFTLTFKNLGVFKVAPDKMEAGGEGVRRVKAEMYCEDIRFTYGTGRP